MLENLNPDVVLIIRISIPVLIFLALVAYFWKVITIFWEYGKMKELPRGSDERKKFADKLHEKIEAFGANSTIREWLFGKRIHRMFKITFDEAQGISRKRKVK